MAFTTEAYGGFGYGDSAIGGMGRRFNKSLINGQLGVTPNASSRTGTAPGTVRSDIKPVEAGTAPTMGPTFTGKPGTSRADAAKAKNPYGTESGPGILEQWFNARATGSDPAFDYGLKRGYQTLDNRYSAAGAYNSGAAQQAGSDLYANLLSQRMGQLDSLAGGASGEHQNRLDSMFRTGLGLAGGQAGTSATYDIPMAGNMKDSAYARSQYEMGKAGVEAGANKGLIDTGFKLAGLYQGVGGGRGGAAPYDPYNVDGGAGNPYPRY